MNRKTQKKTDKKKKKRKQRNKKKRKTEDVRICRLKCSKKKNEELNKPNQIQFNSHVSSRMKDARLLTGEILIIIASTETLQLYIGNYNS